MGSTKLSPLFRSNRENFHYSFVRTKESKADFLAHNPPGHGAHGKHRLEPPPAVGWISGRVAAPGRWGVTSLALVPVGSERRQEGGSGSRLGPPGQDTALAEGGRDKGLQLKVGAKKVRAAGTACASSS